MIDIFLSYAHEDRQRIQPLVELLEAQGWQVWWDAEIDTGVQFDMEIEAAIEAARCIMVVWSNHSIESQWVRSEAHEGLDRNILVPVLFDDVRPPMPFRQIQATDLIDRTYETGEDLDDLFNAVRNALAGVAPGMQSIRSAVPIFRKRRLMGLLVIPLVIFGLVYLANLRPPSPTSTIQPAPEELTEEFQPPTNSIAVLPFVNLGTEAADDYLGAGLAEDLMGELARQFEFHVAARTSSFAFVGQSLSVSDIARQLNVRTVLEGSIRMEGEQIRVSTQLIDAHDGYQLWSGTIIRRLDQMQEIKAEILSQVAGAMRELGGVDDPVDLVSSAPMTEVGAAYQHYLQGKFYWNMRGENNIRKSIRLFKEAIELDADFARAHSSLAAAYVTLPEYSNEPVIPTYQSALRAANEALRLDSTIGEAYSVIAVINHWNWDWVSAEAEFRRAINVEPTDYTSWMWYSELLVELGRLDESEVMLLKALNVDPVSPPVNYLLSWLYLARGENLKALEFARLSVEYGQPYGYLVQSLANLRENRIDDAIESRRKFSEAMEVDPRLGTEVIEAIIDPARVPDVLNRIASVTEQGGFESTTVFFDYFALQTDHILLGQTDRVFQLLEELIDQHFVRLRVLWLPEARAVRKDARMHALAHKLGLTAAWRENGPPDVCRLLESTIECE